MKSQACYRNAWIVVLTVAALVATTELLGHIARARMENRPRRHAVIEHQPWGAQYLRDAAAYQWRYDYYAYGGFRHRAFSSRTINVDAGGVRGTPASCSRSPDVGRVHVRRIDHARGGRARRIYGARVLRAPRECWKSMRPSGELRHRNDLLNVKRAVMMRSGTLWLLQRYAMPRWAGSVSLFHTPAFQRAAATDDIVSTYVRNVEMLRALERQFGFTAYAVWQPFPLLSHKALTPSEREILAEHNSGAPPREVPVA